MKRLNLCLHAGANKVERSDVEKSITPQGTDTHFPIPHNALIELVERKLPEFGLEIVQSQHALMRAKPDADNRIIDNRYFGLYQVQPTDGNVSDDYSLVLGLRNSHDKSFPAGFCLGSGVFVCDNLAFSAEVVIGRRHTRHIMDDLPRLIMAALGKLVTSRVDQARRIDAYKGTTVADAQAALILMQAYEGKAVNKTAISDIWTEWRNPSHVEFTEGGNTVWRLFNAVTEIAKGTNPFELSARTQRLHPILDTACGIKIGVTCKPEDVEDAIWEAKV